MPSKMIVSAVSFFIGFKMGQLQRDGVGLIEKLIEIGKDAVDVDDISSDVVVVPGEVEGVDTDKLWETAYQKGRKEAGEDEAFIKTRYLLLFGEDVRE